ncbi:ABC transporter ATP-binding protein [Marinobacter sp.]|uniref:ABC transporter ATP-binding protein n=1 Tax=Marinobacter sp. TaxID=50741 RepID=UPI00384F2EC0
MTSAEGLDTAPVPAIKSRELSFQWPGSPNMLRYPDLTLAAGEHLFLRGPSGSGKSTLLAMLCGLALPASGQLLVMGTDFCRLSGARRDRFRADHLGVIFQQFNLVPYLDTTANVTLPCRLSARRHSHACPSPREQAQALLQALDIGAEDWHRPVSALSVGQQQRVAAARALIGAPAVILADEPTSALDTGNRDRFMALLLAQASLRGTSVVLVSHDSGLAHRFDRAVNLEAPP